MDLHDRESDEREGSGASSCLVGGLGSWHPAEQQKNVQCFFYVGEEKKCVCVGVSVAILAGGNPGENNDQGHAISRGFVSVVLRLHLQYHCTSNLGALRKPQGLVILCKHRTP